MKRHSQSYASAYEFRNRIFVEALKARARG